MRFTDKRIEDAVADEISDLKSVLDIVAQLPKSVADRILDYCKSYVCGEKQPGTWPAISESDAVELFKQRFAESIAKGNKES